MTYPKRKIEVVPECNDENDNPACWALTICTDPNGKTHFLWITKYDEKEYIVEDSNGYNRAHDKVYKTFRGALKMAEEIAYRQEDTGLFTD